MAQQSGISNITDLLNGITTASKMFTGSQSTQRTSGSKQTQKLDISQEGVKQMISDILESDAGLASTASGQKSAGLYNSTTKQLLVDDLMARASAQVAAKTAPTVTTTSPTTVQTVTPPAMDVGTAALGLGGAMLGKKVWDKLGVGTKIDEVIDGIFGGASGTATSAVSDIAASIPSISGMDAVGEFLSSGAFSGVSDAASSIGNLTDFGFGNVPVLSVASDLLSGKPEDALASIALSFTPLGPAGALLGNVLPVGDAFSTVADVGKGLFDGIGDLFGGFGSVVCTELLRQRRMGLKLYVRDIAHARERMCPAVLRGYRLWGIPLARWMRKNDLVSAVVAPFAVGRARLISGELDVIGLLTCVVGWPLCFTLGQFVSIDSDKRRTEVHAWTL